MDRGAIMGSEGITLALTDAALPGDALAGVSVLVIEDEASITQLVRLYLEQLGARVLAADDGAAGIALFERERPDLIILDLMLPEMDGWEVCQRIRRSSSTPIIMLTARRTEDDRVRGLELGADDYVTKPFSPRELASRVRAILRRASPVTASRPDAECLTFPGLSIFTLARRVEVNGRPVELTAKEFDLLLMLARGAGRVFTRQTLFRHVWGFDYIGDSRTLDVHVGTIRRKLEGESSARQYITTIRGVGYRFDGDAEQGQL
jgi:two-component system response regulator ResD